MRKQKVILFCVSFIMLFAGCSKKSAKDAALNYSSLNDEYIQAITPTYISRDSDVKISFTKNITCPEFLLSEAVNFTPKQSGKFKLLDENTIVFEPESAYKANSVITLQADVNKLLGIEEVSSIYEHPFVVQGATYDVTFDNLILNQGGSSYVLSGKIKTDIAESAEVIVKTLSAKLGGKKLKIEIENALAGEKLKEWKFTIPEVAIGAKDKVLSVLYSGKNIGLNSYERKAYSGNRRYIIPAFSSDFSIIDVNNSNKNEVSFSFSKALDTAQDILEYVKLFDKNNSRMNSKFNPVIKNNILTIYSDDNFESVDSMTVSAGVLSSDGIKLAQAKNVTLSGNWVIPEVRFMTDGNILPTSQGTVLPVETKNLSGLLIQAFVVPDYNMNQFFQVNDYSGTRDLYRVGEPVWEKNLSFGWKDNMQNKFVPRGIDISELVKKYPGGMFQIRISFRKNNIMYICSKNHDDFSKLPSPPETLGSEYKPREKSYWDNSEMNYEQRRSYWTYRNDPCHPAFYQSNYNSSSTITRNIFVSDIGLMAKIESDGKLFVNTSNLKTTEPINNLSIKVYNFIGKKIAEAKTDKAGRAVFEDANNAYTIVASDGKQISYLVINSGTALSTSHFETGGVKAENGVKGFIYGERGVWRPGDDIYLTFVLQDINKTLPKNIPVVFSFTDPLGHEVESRILSESVNGFYPITAKTLAEAPTGLWNAKIKIGGKEWNKSIRIETVVPNHLAVNLEVEDGFLFAGENYFTLSGAWLHGAEIPGYKADVTVSFSKGNSGFDGFSEYTFENPSSFVDSSKETIFEGNLGSNSSVQFKKRLSAGKDIPGKLTAHFTNRIFEPSGVPSTSAVTYEYSPFSRYVGLKLPKGDEARGMLLTDVKHRADIVLLDEKGEFVKSGRLNYSIYKMDWKWWWEKDAYTSATYVGNQNYTKIDSGNIEIADGRGYFEFEVKYPSWGRYLVQVSDGYNGHTTGNVVYIDWPGWAGRSQQEGSGSTAMLPLSVEKKQYSVGESAKVSFASTKGERALVTIEKSGNILSQEWIQTTDGTTVWQLPLTEEMSPNVYVHVTLLQPHLQTQNSLPIRLYGVVPVMVDNPATKMEPVITCKDKFEPVSKTVVSVSEKNGKPMTYTLAVVDEGLLGLTAFKAPDLRSEFYKKEASLLENWDLYKFVMNAYSGKLETILAIGGSEEIIDNSDANSNRFTPVVKYFGPYELKAGEKKITEFDMPNYMGAVRIMVIAGDNGAYGVSEKSVPVKSDLMMLPSLPRTLGMNEEIKIPVTLYNGTDRKLVVPVTMNCTGVVNKRVENTVTIEPNADAIAYLPLSTKGAVEGKTYVEILAGSGGFKQNVRVDVDVKSRGIPATYKTDFVIKKGTKTVTVDSPLEAGTFRLKAELTTMPMVNLNNRLEYLTNYPHGCIEQITSGAFPQLFLSDFVQLSNEENEKIIQNVNSVIERYPQYQNMNGSFSYWSGGNTAHLWGTTYATHFLIEAKRHGYKVPDSIYNPLVNWLAETAQSFGSYISDVESIENQVYSLYVLALSGHADIGSMNRIKDSVKEDTSKMLLASAYAVCSRINDAKEIIKGVKFNNSRYNLMNKNFSSSLRDQSIALMCCDYVGNESLASKYAKAICEDLNSDRWLSTQETAWALFTILPHYNSEKNEICSYSIESNGKTINGDIEKKTDIVELPVSDLVKQTAVMTNNSKKTLYGTLSANGRTVPGTEVAKSEGLVLNVVYENSNYVKIKPEQLKTGDTFRIKVSLKNNENVDVQNIALSIPIPTAWEISNDRLSKTSDKNFDYTYRDIKDDCIYTYLDLKNHSTKQFTIDASVAFDGSYYVPAISAEAMYDDSYSAIIPGMYVQGK